METVQKSQLNYQIRYYLSEHFIHLQLLFVISDRKHELVSLLSCQTICLDFKGRK